MPFVWRGGRIKIGMACNAEPLGWWWNIQLYYLVAQLSHVGHLEGLERQRIWALVMDDLTCHI